MKKQAPLATRSSSSRYVSGSRAPHCRTVLTPKWAEQNPDSITHEQSIMKYSPRLPEDIKPLRSCSWKQSEDASQKSSAKQMSFPIYQGHRLPHHSSPIINGGHLGCSARDLETVIVLVLLAFKFIPKCNTTHRVSYGNIGLTTVAVTPGLLSEMSLIFFLKGTNPPWEQYIT